jgi:hypothetical protein
MENIVELCCHSMFHPVIGDIVFSNVGFGMFGDMLVKT